MPAYSGDGGAASSAALSYPQGVAVDATGNVYVADQNNHRVRVISRRTGIIATVAGTGTLGPGGDGMAATMAQLNSPQGVAVDASGNVFIGESLRVRLVTRSTGIITTVAGTGMYGNGGDGGAATSASFSMIYGVAVDASGNVYVADQMSDNVRVVTRSTGIVTAFAGRAGQYGTTGDGGPATSASFSFVTGVAVDASGNVFISDANGNKIREVAASAGTTVAGTSSLPSPERFCCLWVCFESCDVVAVSRFITFP